MSELSVKEELLMKIDQRIQYARATEKQMGGVINLTFADDMIHISQSGNIIIS